MSGAPRSDERARNAVRTQLGTTAFVDAGAGTGKTTALVGRVVELVRSGVPISSIAAITFTEPAADELRERLREALEAQQAAGSVPAGTVEELDEAAITTLHGFARRLLAAAPLAAGLPPRFELFDEVAARVAFDQRWAAHCDEAEHDPRAVALTERALAMGVGYPALRDVARCLHQERHRLDAAGLVDRSGADLPDQPAVDVARVVTALRRAAARTVDARDAADGLCVLLAGSRERPGFEELACQLDAADGDLARLELLVALDATRSRRSDGTKSNGPPGNKTKWRVDVDEVRALRDEAFAEVDRVLATVSEALSRGLVAHLAGFVRTYADERRRQGTLEFADLLVLARDLLRSDPGARSRLSARYQRLLIDEFQDTDPLQIEIVTLLTTGHDDVGDTPWELLPVEAGRAFFVGDAKQSIYRFRGADLRQFEQTRRTHGGQNLVLDNNFRSVPGILTWVNAVFAELLGLGTDQAAPQHLAAARLPLPGSPPPVHVIGSVVDDARIGALRDVEAAEVAALLTEAHRAGWPVGDGRRGEQATRPVGWDDMAVLLPTRLGLAHLEAAFTAEQVPYRVDSASLVWTAAPIRDVLLVLRALADPNDAISLVGALRSPLLGCSDEALLEYHRAGGRWQRWPWRQAPAALAADHPVLVALDALGRLHRELRQRSVGELVDRTVRGLGAFELATVHRRPRDHWRRLRYLVAEARAFSERSAGTLAEFLAWTDLQGSDDARAREPVLPEDDDDAVRVLTVHGAKGREFPVCVVSGLNSAPSSKASKVLWNGADRPLATFSHLVTDDGYAELKRRELADADAERIRLLYVAATRARDHLVVCVHRLRRDDGYAETAPAKASLAALVAHAGDAVHATVADVVDTTVPETALLSETARPGAGVADRFRPDALDALDAWRAEEQAWLAERRALLARQVRQPVLAATTLASRARLGVAPLGTEPPPAVPGPGDGAGLLTDGPSGAVDEPHADGRPGTAAHGDAGGHSDAADEPVLPSSPEPPEDAPPRRRGRAGTAIGRAVHATLQLADLNDPASVGPLAASQAAAEGVPGRVREVAGLARAALASDVVRAAVGARHWRELYVAAPVGDTLLEGFVDLLYNSPTGLVVVDYKTDAVRDEAAVDAAVARYRLQLAAYALLVGTTTGRAVAGAALVFLSGGRAHTRWVDDLAGAVAEIRAGLGAGAVPTPAR